MSVFSDEFQPNNLPPKDYVAFTLHVMSGYLVDLSQPGIWTQVALPDGRGAPRYRIARAISPKIKELGGVLTPKMLGNIISTFKIHGPEISEELAWKNRPEETNGELGGDE
jgi:hypothetical protein